MQRKQTTRRDFMKQSAALTSAAAIPYFSWTEKTFANQAKNDRPRIGCIGVGGMGSGHLRAINALKKPDNVEAVAVADSPQWINSGRPAFVWASEAKVACGKAYGYLQSEYRDEDYLNKCECFHARMVRYMY